MTKIAVYGSLLSGLHNHRLLGDSKLLEHKIITGPYMMVDLGNYPGLVKSAYNNSITVEIYEVTKKTFKRLDELESYPNFYNREYIQCLEDTWIYFLNDYDRHVEHLVLSGDWKSYYNNKLNYVLS